MALRILAVEDNQVNMILIHDLLVLNGYTVLKAFTAEDAIEMARRERPDLILMDVGLPGMDGLAATRLLKEMAETKDIPVLALTAHAMPGDQERTIAAGCCGYISKPFNVPRFLELVADYARRANRPAT